MKMNSEVNGLVVGHKRDGRCKYDSKAKQELIRQCLNPGVSVSRMAMQHGVNANLLRSWITKYQRTTISVAEPIQAEMSGTAPAFVPVQIGSSAPSTGMRAPALRLQVHLPNGVDLDIDTAQAGQLMEVMQMLSNLPCSN